MRSACGFVVSLVLACSAGCLPLFYAYPSIAYIPELSVGPNHADMHVFRVNITDDSNSPGQYSLCQLPISPNGAIWGQEHSALNEGFGTKRINHTLQVRLYRRGYDLIEIHSWQCDQPIQWKEAAGARGREKAIDGLLAPTEAGSHSVREQEPLAHLQPGSASAPHREALLFAANEYQYLADRIDALGEDHNRACERCLAKAKEVRQLAER